MTEDATDPIELDDFLVDELDGMGEEMHRLTKALAAGAAVFLFLALWLGLRLRTTPADVNRANHLLHEEVISELQIIKTHLGIEDPEQPDT